MAANKSIIILFCLVFLCILSVVTCKSGPNILPASGCVHEGITMKIGSAHRPLDKCIQYSCVKKGVINAKICPLAAAKQNCTIIEDVTQPFPKCCATLEC